MCHVLQSDWGQEIPKRGHAGCARFPRPFLVGGGGGGGGAEEGLGTRLGWDMHIMEYVPPLYINFARVCLVMLMDSDSLKS